MTFSEVSNAPAASALRADVCLLALADVFRGDGEILANGIGPFARLSSILARESFEPDLLITDGEALLISAAEEIEGWNPYRKMFDLLWGGHRHVIMGASQLDRYGNQNLAYIGSDPTRPKRQLIGFRGAAGNTINHVTSYWIPNHSPRVFVPSVDVVCGIGYDRAAELDPWTTRFHEIRRVVTNLAVLDFDTEDRRMQVLSVHPNVSLDDVRLATGFDLAVSESLAETPVPDADTMTLIARLDPGRSRYREVTEN